MSVAHNLRLGARNIIGIDFQRHDASSDPFIRLVEMLRQARIDAVLDVGANDGGYASDLLDAGYHGRVYSFEPLPDAHKALTLRAARYPRKWIVCPRVALSNEDATATFHEAGNSVSSSLLPMMDAHTSAAPSSATQRTLEVKTSKLDTILPTIWRGGDIFLKIDVQGAEHMVLEGAEAALGGPIRGVQLEMSLTELYSGQCLATELDAFLRARGFKLWDMLPGFRDPKTHRLLQYDGVYFHSQERGGLARDAPPCEGRDSDEH